LFRNKKKTDLRKQPRAYTEIRALPRVNGPFCTKLEVREKVRDVFFESVHNGLDVWYICKFVCERCQ